MEIFMRGSYLIKYIAVLLCAIMILSLFACNTESNGETDTRDKLTETDTETGTEGESDSVDDADTETQKEIETETDTEYVGPSEPGCQDGACSFKTQNGKPICKNCGFVALCNGVHGYEADENGHFKPACEHCGKVSGSSQNHEFAEKVDDAGNAWSYMYRCKICKYVAYEQIVPYKITSFFSAGELSGIDTNRTFASEFRFDMGTGFAAYTMNSVGTGKVMISNGDENDVESGKYLVIKLRLPASQSGFNVSIKSACASKSYNMVFNELRPGWVTLIIDMTKAISQDKDGTIGGYRIDANSEYYLSELALNCRVLAEESLDVAYVMICDTLDEANDFTSSEKQVYFYEDIANDSPEFLSRPCTDKDGNIISHSFESDENGHTVKDGCNQCGLRAVKNEAHTYAHMRVDGELTYACSVCGYLQYGYYLNKYFSAQDINGNALVYYKVNKQVVSENGLEFVRFTGQSTTAQVIFARHNSSTESSTLQSAADQMAAAFSAGKGSLLVVRMRTNDPSVKFSMWLGGAPNKEMKVIFPTSFATVVSNTDAETVEYGWTTYVVDLERAIPSTLIPDENGEYKLHNFYFQMEKGDSGTEFSADVSFDIEFAAIVDSWDELKMLVPDQTVVKVNASNYGTIVKTQEQECVGEHSWGENIDGNTYSYLCVNCGKPVKSITVPDSVQRYISGFEAARNATLYALPGTRNIIIDSDNTVFGRVNGCGQLWWMRDQKDYADGKTGASLDAKRIDVGNSKYLVVRLRTDDNKKNFEFYISTTAKNGTPRTEAEIEDKKPITVPTTSGIILLTSPTQASTVGEWTTYVYDLEELIPEYYVKDSESGTYILDTFGIYCSKDYNADIDFIAFVDGGWDDIDALTPDETVVYSTHYQNKAYTIVNTATGK